MNPAPWPERVASRLRWITVVLFAAVLCGCAGTLPSHHDREPSLTWVAPSGTAVADIAERAAIPADTSAVWPLPQAAFALDARLASIAHATRSVDVQTYRLDDDDVGRWILGALAKAAARGVRVRLLVDDFYTTGLDSLLLGLATYPNAEVRVFNPFVRGRASSSGRLLALATDFRRLDHRMHNKLFVVDGQVAIAGGRNIANDYFLRGKVGNFFDIDLLLIGPVVASLISHFDRYWNSEQAYDIHEIAEATGTSRDDADLQSAFERRTAGETIPPPPLHDEFGVEPFSVQLATGRFSFVPVNESRVHADTPEKMLAIRGVDQDTVSRRFLDGLVDAQREVVIFSPYFIPDTRMME